MTHIVHTNRVDSSNKIVDIDDLELVLERDLIEEANENAKILSEDIFGDSLLLLDNEGYTAVGKRYDILALDGNGNAVIIELKRNKGRRGIETQALGYLADISARKGKQFLAQFPAEVQANIRSFLGENYSENDINSSPRIILMARSFDRAVFALGEWLASNGVPFRCVQFRRVSLGEDRLLVFSTVFDRSRDPLFSLQFSPAAKRESRIFWHIIGNNDWPENQQDAWWEFLRANGLVTASFDNAPGDTGEALLHEYVQGDRVIAYAVKKGAIGGGLIQKDPVDAYQLIELDDDQVQFANGHHLHRLSGVAWQACAPSLTQAIPASEFEVSGPYHPIGTRASIKSEKGEWLIGQLNRRFGTTAANV
jgi:hypothetical protein